MTCINFKMTDTIIVCWYVGGEGGESLPGWIYLATNCTLLLCVICFSDTFLKRWCIIQLHHTHILLIFVLCLLTTLHLNIIHNTMYTCFFFFFFFTTMYTRYCCCAAEYRIIHQHCIDLSWCLSYIVAYGTTNTYSLSELYFTHRFFSATFLSLPPFPLPPPN